MLVHKFYFTYQSWGSSLILTGMVFAMDPSGEFICPFGMLGWVGIGAGVGLLPFIIFSMAGLKKKKLVSSTFNS